jgi:hypothetical protein
MSPAPDDRSADLIDLRRVRIERQQQEHRLALEQSDYERELAAQKRRALLAVVQGDA